MPKSFLVKKSSLPATSSSRGVQEKCSPNSLEESDDKWPEIYPFPENTADLEKRWEPLDMYETGIEDAYSLERELQLPWLRGRESINITVTQHLAGKVPKLLSDPVESIPHEFSEVKSGISPTLNRRASPFPFDVNSKPNELPPFIKGMPPLEFHPAGVVFENFVHYPQPREMLFQSSQEPISPVVPIEGRPNFKLLPNDQTNTAPVPTPRRRPLLLCNAGVIPRLIPSEPNRKSHVSSFSETNTVLEPSPKKSRTAYESSPPDTNPVNFSEEKKEHEKPFKCNHCVMSFTRPSDLQRHLLIHNNNKPYKCGECDREFTWFGNFQKHILSHMNGGSPGAGSRAFSAMFTLLARDQIKDLFIKEGDKYKCRLCSKDFTRLSGLKTHIRMHTGERPYVCEVCSFAFTTSRALKMHMRLHTGEKPYKCEVCDRAFTRRDEMHTHMYIHKGEKPFKCDKCPASFIRYGHLQRHLLIHSDDKPYKCKLCPKSFTQYRNLQTHMYKHTGERPYRCKFCPKGFTQYGTLQAHERTHTGEKPFRCHMCDKAFITSSHLRWHIKTQHGQE